MSARSACLIAAAVLVLSTASFTAQEPPRNARPPLDPPGPPVAPTPLDPPGPPAAPTPLDLPGPPVAPKPPPPREPEVSIRLEFRAGKDKDDHRIVWKRDGVEIDATRIIIGKDALGMELLAGPEGIEVRSSAFNTVCKSIDVRPGMLAAGAGYLPSSKSTGQLYIERSSTRAIVTCQDFWFECTRLVLAGEGNRLEVVPGEKALQVKTKDADIRAASVSVTYKAGFRLNLEVTTDSRQTIRLAQQP
jgi:hypothetical protein